MYNTDLFSVRIETKHDICIETHELNRMNLRHIFSQHNLCSYDVQKLKNKAKKHLKNSRLIFYKQENRAQYVFNLKSLYPNYTFRQLREIGFNI